MSERNRAFWQLFGSWLLVSRSFLVATIQLGSLIGASGQDLIQMHTPTERGQYVENKRVGVWAYRDRPSAASLMVDYSKGELVYVDKDTGDFVISDNGGWMRGKLDIPCRFHGPISDLVAHYQRAVAKILPRLADKERILNTNLIFEVSEAGRAENLFLKGDHDPETGKILQEAFESAPNFWIVGINEDGVAVRTRHRIAFRICIGPCQNYLEEIADARTLAVIDNYYYTKKVPYVRDPMGERIRAAAENNGIQFSPDDHHILMQVAREDANGRKVQIGLVVDRQTQEVVVLPFKDIKGCAWVSPRQVLFKYHFPDYGMVPAVFDIDTKEIVQYSDSVTFFATYARHQDQVAMVTYDTGHFQLWYGKVAQRNKDRLIADSKTMIAPFNFSPDGSKLLLLEQKHGLEKPVVLELISKSRKTVPIFDSAFSGWSEDGGSIFFWKVIKHDYKYTGEIIKYDLANDELTVVFPSAKNLWSAYYSFSLHVFAIAMGSDLYLWEPTAHLAPILLRKNVGSRMAWSHDGTSIAFLGRSDGDLYTYDCKTGAFVRLTKF